MKRFTIIFFLLIFHSLSSEVVGQTKGRELIAIDILIEPDAQMIKNVTTVNSKLHKDYPKGFLVDAAHPPHVTLVQRFIHRDQLDEVVEAIKKAIAEQNPLPFRLVTTGYLTSIWNYVEILGYEVESTPELAQFERKIVTATQPFSVHGGTEAAFVKETDESINTETIRYVETFVPNSSGNNFKPHITVGTAHPTFLKKMESEPFRRLSFTGINVAIYQLGNFGTAQKKLWPSDTK
jgi:2'-5' RNA ligase